MSQTDTKLSALLRLRLRLRYITPGEDVRQGKPSEVYGEKTACQIRHFREWKGKYVRKKVILRCN